MKKLSLVLLCFFWFSVCSADVNVVVGQPIVAASVDPTPDFQAKLDDNTTGTTVVAAYGSNATLVNATNTSDVHNADAIEGTGSFEGDANNLVRMTPPEAWMTDEVFTVQLSIKGDTSGLPNAYVRLFESSLANALVLMRNNSDTSLVLYVGGTNSGTFTVNDIDDNQWHTLRIVIDGTNTIRMYQKTESGAWSSAGTSETNPGNITTFTALSFGNDGAGVKPWGSATGTYLIDNLIIWNSVAVPE